MARLREEFETRIKPALMDEFNYKSVMEVPKLEKIVINMGVGEASQARKKVAGAVTDKEPTRIGAEQIVGQPRQRPPGSRWGGVGN